nr:MAG TPA: hypothetical protein [Siphovirus LN-2020-1]FAA01751.1 MAG TPA: hypothetical protein [Siphovirus LN-2020-1]
MPGITPLLHAKVRGESSPFSTVYISPTNGVTDASITLGADPNFELDVAFYEGSKALLRVVRKDGTSDQKVIDLKESMPEKVVWFNSRAGAGYGTFDSGWKEIATGDGAGSYQYRVMAGMVYVRIKGDGWQGANFAGPLNVERSLVKIPADVQVKNRTCFPLPKGDGTIDGSIIEVRPNNTVVMYIKAEGNRIVPTVFAPIENSNG